jgi:energy-coupling factor transporter ATP-binding protein EcfA2
MIVSVRIQNFRSIVKMTKEDFTPNNLNIIVGNNDMGKSNLLKALNLFFNNQTDLDKPYRFEDDFSFYAQTGKGKAKEILIELVLQPPFANTKQVVWKKTWRQEQNTAFENEYKYIDKTDIGKSNTRQWLNKLIFEYVPAVKGQTYFSHLMGKLHDVLNKVYENKFKTDSSKFIEGIQDATTNITDNLEKLLGIKNKIQIPSEFKTLFSTLDFGFEKDGKTFLLSKRGDGIKARHIPIILKYIADQEKSLSKQGFTKPDIIWGFEEPENNLEMSKAFELANTFLDYSKDIQIFINTHSPAFYSLRNNNNNTNVYLMKSDKGISQIVQLKDNAVSVLDEQMGIIHYITPFIEEKNQQILKLQQAIIEFEKIKSNTKCIVLTEDKDTKYCQLIFEMQGFDTSTTEYVSYAGRTNLLAAMQSCEVKLSDKPNLTNIIFHRDRDIYDNDEEDKERVAKKLANLNKANKIKYDLFLTENYDLEAYLLNAEHIVAISSKYSLEDVKRFIEEATTETEDKSLDKLYEKIKIIQKGFIERGEGIKFSHSKSIKEIQTLYKSNPIRYRYGKTVLGKLKDKLQKGSVKIDIEQKSDKIKIPELIAIAKNIK